MLLWLAMTDAEEKARTQGFFWSAILMGVAILGFGAIMLFKHFWKKNEAASEDVGFSLSELKAMRDRGEITIQEYEQTRANVIAKVKQRMNEPRPAKPAKQEPGPTDLAE